MRGQASGGGLIDNFRRFRGPLMRANGFVGSLGALRRKVRALASVAEDAAATPPERANAEALKERLEQQLRAAQAPAGDWTDKAFRLGRWVTDMRKSTAPARANGDWTDNVHRLGKAVGRGYRKWWSG